MIEHAGNYRIIDEIAAGGMAVVYKGVQESISRTVAIKALKTSMSADENVVARFKREALSLASFQHENITTLYDYFTEHGALFMVLEYVEGIDVYDLLERCGRIPVDVAAIIALQVSRGLDYAHFRGVVHRDVKPANIILSKLGEVKLTDFGIARTEASDLTEAGIGLGTPAYMSPEQIVGDNLDHRTDMWSLAVVLYQMITGFKPFAEAEERSVMQAIRLHQPARPRDLVPSIPKDIERILERCLKKSPEERYGSTQDLVIDLEHFLAIHVRQNYRARLIMFLKEQQVISGNETDATLHPALIGGSYSGTVVRRRRGHRRLRWRPLILLTGGLLAGTGAGFAAAKLTQPTPTTAQSSRAQNEICAATDEPQAKQEGYLHVLAQPWAQIEVDGKTVDTTPHSPLPLPPGRHKLRLTNSYGFKPMEMEVIIEPGQTTTVTEVLQRQSQAGETP